MLVDSKDDVVIRVEHVYKDFVLPHERVNSLKSAFTSLTKKRSNQPTETQHALKDISFEIKRGEFFGIVGRNGSGKSTMLKILAGIYQPSKGKISTNGKLVPFIELGVGFNAELTGRENVYLNGAMLGFSEKEVNAMYDEIVSFAELERFMDQKLKNYSSGMQVRLAFSMATRAKAEILLVDEVLAVGDADFQRKCFAYFRSLKKNHKTVVFVSHDMSAVREYCERAILIDNNKVVEAGTSARIATAYTKLFTNTAQEEKITVAEMKAKRWGDKGVQQTAVSIKPGVKIMDDNKEIIVRVEYEASVLANEPILGFVIKNGAGVQLVGTNTKIRGIDTGTLQPGQKGVMEWSVPNVFNDGTYLIDVAISHQDNITQYDWWEDAATFSVFKNEKTPYAIAPRVDGKFTS